MKITNYNDKEPINKGLWSTLGLMIFIGVAMVFGFAAGSSFTYPMFLTTSSTGLLIGGAFFTAGGLGGFLFGIPKLLQNTAVIPNTSSNTTVILHNDNLVQISDWLTKIIVGVGLTQLYSIPHYIRKVSVELQDSFGGPAYGGDKTLGDLHNEGKLIIPGLVQDNYSINIIDEEYFEDYNEIFEVKSDLNKTIVLVNRKEPKIKFSLLGVVNYKFPKLPNPLEGFGYA